jgi:HNH endonuclease
MRKEIFESRFKKTATCWIWHGTIVHGYGQYYQVGKTSAAHRIAYELYVGSIPDGLEIDHTCHNTLCVNPAHLEPVTSEENARRNRSETCRHGHIRTVQNTYFKPNGDRECKICRDIRQRRR